MGKFVDGVSKNRGQEMVRRVAESLDEFSDKQRITLVSKCRLAEVFHSSMEEEDDEDDEDFSRRQKRKRSYVKNTTSGDASLPDITPPPIASSSIQHVDVPPPALRLPEFDNSMVASRFQGVGKENLFCVTIQKPSPTTRL